MLIDHINAISHPPPIPQRQLCDMPPAPYTPTFPALNLGGANSNAVPAITTSLHPHSGGLFQCGASARELGFSLHLSVVCLSFCLSVCLSICLSVCLSGMRLCLCIELPIVVPGPWSRPWSMAPAIFFIFL